MRYLLSFLLLFPVACTKGNYDCAPPPPSIGFRFIDEKTGEDLLAAKKLAAGNFEAVNETQKKFDIFVRGDDTLKIASVVIGGAVGKHTYQLQAGEKVVRFSMEVVNGDCGPAKKEEKIISPASTFDSRGFYIIKF